MFVSRHDASSAIIRLMADDWNRLRAALIEARVSGSEDLGPLCK
jgi:hypothetical protein